MCTVFCFFFFFSSRRRHTRWPRDWSSDVCSSDLKWLANKGWDPVMGARPLRRTIQREIEDPLSERILFNELGPGQIAVVDCDGDPTTGRLVFRTASPGREKEVHSGLVTA